MQASLSLDQLVRLTVAPPAAIAKNNDPDGKNVLCIGNRNKPCVVLILDLRVSSLYPQSAIESCYFNPGQDALY